MVVLLFLLLATEGVKPPPKLQIGIKKRSSESCTVKAEVGSRIQVHYTAKLHDGLVLVDSNLAVDGQAPFEFTLGSGRAIKGWDRGLVGMCVGEVRKLVVPSDLAFGISGALPTIPPDAAMVFDVELVGILPVDTFI